MIDNAEYVGSGAFVTLEKKADSKINKETLLVLLKSKPIARLVIRAKYWNYISSYC